MQARKKNNDFAHMQLHPTMQLKSNAIILIPTPLATSFLGIPQQ